MAAEHCTYENLMNKIALLLHKKPPSIKAPASLLKIAWKWEALKAVFSKNEPLITKETVRKAYTKTVYDSGKLNHYLPEFTYTHIDITLQRTCEWLKEHYR
jgi:hypothetical protein